MKNVTNITNMEQQAKEAKEIMDVIDAVFTSHLKDLGYTVEQVHDNFIIRKQSIKKEKQIKRRNNNTGIKIGTQKVINDKGEQCRKIICVKALPKHKLPKMYTNSGTEVVYRSIKHLKGLIYTFDELHETQMYYIGKVLTEDAYQTLIQRCNAAGENLRLINKKIKEMKQEWNGEEIVII